MKRLLASFALIFMLGCTTQYYKEVDGTSLLLGVSLPDEDYIQINALTYLGGSKTTVKEPSHIIHEYEAYSTNSYFGVIQTKEYRKSKIAVSPTNMMYTVVK